MLRSIFKRAGFLRDIRGSIAPMFGLALIPVVAAVGGAVDYSRANNFRAKLQSALDSAVLAGARDGSANWNKVAQNVFNANIQDSSAQSLQLTVNFTVDSGPVYQGAADATVGTAFLGLMRVASLAVAARATATYVEADNSCILTLDKGQPATHVALSLNGAPVVDLSGCSIRSNTALDCNGHDGNVTKSIAGGVASGCSNPKSYAPTVPDIYAAIATNITPVCGTTRGSVTWTPGSIPAVGTYFKTATDKGGRTEYHVCGDLTFDGTGTVTGPVASADTSIVIENGSLNITNNSSVSVVRMVIVLTGNNSYASQVNFPMGNGKVASLTLSPPLDASNPWQGIALYQDPKLTFNVNNKWGPGADFSADGLVYLGNSNVVTDGNTTSSNAKCSKFVMNQFTTNGKVLLDFDQSVASCAAIGLKQWGGVTVHLKT